MIDLKRIETIKIFEKIEIEELEKILNQITYRVKKIEKNKIYKSRGSEIEGLYIVLEGVLSAEMLREDGDIKKIENLKKSDWIASGFIFADKNRFPVDLIALKDTEVLEIDKGNLLKLFNIDNRIMLNFLKNISNRVCFLSEKIWNLFNAKTIKEKLERYIEENRKNDIVVFKHTIKELAEIFSVSRPSLSRVISTYIREGKLEKKDKNIFRIKK